MTRRVTLKEVATQAGVSYQTVSKVLNGQVHVSKPTEERIRQAARALGYRPNHIARSLRSHQTKLIGYSWEDTPPNQFNPILDQFLESMVQAAEGYGYHLLAFPFRHGDERLALYRELIDTNRVDAFVISSVNYNDPRIPFLQSQNFPFVAFGRSNPEWTFPWVDVDGKAGLHLMMDHLLAQGHRRIFALAWPAESRVGQDRMEGYLEALAAAGLTTQEDWIRRGEGTYECGLEETARWLTLPKKHRPTAIVAFNDNMAIGAMSAARQAGLQVGVDLAVTGFDDIPMGQYLTPPLTSVRQPIWDVGKLVMEKLLEIFNHKKSEQSQILVKPELVIRESSRFRVKRL